MESGLFIAFARVSLAQLDKVLDRLGYLVAEEAHLDAAHALAPDLDVEVDRVRHLGVFLQGLAFLTAAKEAIQEPHFQLDRPGRLFNRDCEAYSTLEEANGRDQER